MPTTITATKHQVAWHNKPVSLLLWRCNCFNCVRWPNSVPIGPCHSLTGQAQIDQQPQQLRHAMAYQVIDITNPSSCCCRDAIGLNGRDSRILLEFYLVTTSRRPDKTVLIKNHNKYNNHRNTSAIDTTNPSICCR